jgi:hypothetical protein
MSMFYRTKTRTESSGGTTSTITSIIFLIRQTSSANVQEYAKLTCDIGQYGTTAADPCATADPRDSLQDGMSFSRVGSFESEVVDPANLLIQLGAGPARSSPFHFMSQTALKLSHTIP